MAKAEFKLRYEGSYLGIFWYLFNPLLTFALLFFIFSKRLGGNIDNYPLYLLLGIIMFNFFRQSTIEATQVIYENRHLIKSIKFPYIALVTSVVIKTFFSHLFEIGVFLLFLILFRLPIINIALYPLVLLPLGFFTLGASLFLSALTIYIVDIENVWIFVSRLLWFATPIFYSIEELGNLKSLVLLNPIYFFIEIARDIIIDQSSPSLEIVAGAVFYSFLTLGAGFFVFNKLETKFTENI